MRSKATPAVKQAFKQLQEGAAVAELATKKLGVDWSDNKAKQHLKTNEEYNNDRRAAIKAAGEAHLEGLQLARQSYEQIRSALRSEVLPKSATDANQQLLDRQLFDLALGNGDGAIIGSRALRIAQGKDERSRPSSCRPTAKRACKAGVHQRTVADVEDNVIASSDHPNAKLAKEISRLEGVMVALDTNHRLKAKRL